MKIGTLAKKTGLSPHTLRYYERIGLLPVVYRDSSGQRDYDQRVLDRLEFLSKLRTTGMPLRDMQLYAELVTQGESTADLRRQLLEQHRQQVRHRLAELQSCLLVIDKKIDGYCNNSHTITDTTGDPK
ncbi:MerR family transcriptional regulator [Budviciaceae bacterium CWB-B4]|uniref:MerR family transcriptional regulator n=1 Tax=Limnobaculum xujianqingii TaxID=2738837 RepID=A0A9D7AEW4_9GAMM|nr:MerR family transcriptional regulator [Limnobaculum xujianqingii]MBK5071420.1 MerR family transcriptional regulator [Limnobaculum xujianqingii]MBK5174729.1 MerR family transcriptional regulator [Limnobaculum xujianqingii]